MTVGRWLKRKSKAALPPVIFLALVGYFGWNATQGDRGLETYGRRLTVLSVAQADLAKTVAEREAWEQRVSGLRTNHLDADTLDERARAMLNLADKDDVVVPYAQGQRLFQPQ